MRIPNTAEAIRSAVVHPRVAQTQRGVASMAESAGSGVVEAARHGVSDFTPAGHRCAGGPFAGATDPLGAFEGSGKAAFEKAAQSARDVIGPPLPTDLPWQSPSWLP